MYPKVGIVVPCRDSHHVIGALVHSLLETARCYPGETKIILVGSIGDTTWKPIAPLIEQGAVQTYEVASPTPHLRDASIKRKAGAQVAVDCGCGILFFTDTRIRVPADTIMKGMHLLAHTQADAVGGTYRRLPEQQSWWARVQDEGLITDVPRWGSGRFLDPSRTLSMPITACLFMTAHSFESIQSEWPGQANRYLNLSHEDTAIALPLLRRGLRLWVTDDVYVYHHHRSSIATLTLKWTRSGIAVANMLNADPSNAFAASRLRKVAAVLGALAALLIIVLTTTTAFGMAGMTFSMTVGLAGLVGLGLLNAWKARSLDAISYPLGTIWLVLIFTLAFTHAWLDDCPADESLLQIR
jgi:hypothetical protein